MQTWDSRTLLGNAATVQRKRLQIPILTAQINHEISKNKSKLFQVLPVPTEPLQICMQVEWSVDIKQSLVKTFSLIVFT